MPACRSTAARSQTIPPASCARAKIGCVRLSANARIVVLVGLVVFAIGLLVFGVALNRGGSPDRLAGSAAESAAKSDAGVKDWLAAHPYDRVAVIPLDRDNARVSFFNGSRAVIEVAVAPDGRVIATQPFDKNYVRAGQPDVQMWFALALCALVFLLLLATRPLVSVRNADLLAFAALASTIWLLNQRLFALSVVVGTLLMGYLVGRCLRIASRERIDSPQTQFLVGFGSDAKRVAALVTFAAAAIGVIATIPGGQVGDVSIASMGGATSLLDGVLPYGNVIDGIVHGDTYPIFAYVLYAPAALVWPVHDLFDNLDGGLWIAAISLIAAAVAIFRAGSRAIDAEFGLRHAAAWIIFPPVLVASTAGANDLPTAALVAWSVATFAHAGRSAGWLSAAAWAKVVPVFVLPLWIARFRGRELRSALIGPVVLTALMLVLLVALGGVDAIHKMLDAITFQSERGSQICIWTVLGAPALQLVAQAVAFALAAAGAVAVWRTESLAQSLPRVAALAAATLLAFQIGASYWSYAYLPWVYPLLIVALCWPARGPHRPTP